MAITEHPITFGFDPPATLWDLEHACSRLRDAGAEADSLIRVRTKADMSRHGGRLTAITAIRNEETA